TLWPTCCSNCTVPSLTSAYVVVVVVLPSALNSVVRRTGATRSSTYDLVCVPDCTQPVYVTRCASSVLTVVFTLSDCAWTSDAQPSARANVARRFMSSSLVVTSGLSRTTRQKGA